MSRIMLRFITVPPKTSNELRQVIRKAAADTFADRPDPHSLVAHLRN